MSRVSEDKFVVVPNPHLLLHPNIPKPMHGCAPRNILGGPWWSREREAAFYAAKYRCEACGTHKTKAKARQWLEGHELYDIDYIAGRMVYQRTVSLCHYCHNYIHSGRLYNLLIQGKIHQAKYTAIIQHGEDILRANDLLETERLQDRATINMVETGAVAPWSSWRMVVNNQEYPPVYDTEDDWERFHKIGDDE